ncbi:MAG: BadF/BadG/BcrA/BcrD ATPase family protein [Paracoccaceae bacterium]|nr:BadF/BadG/BcrA/BcrD ATPase family protein [Paracoccaceae bacterium]
MSSAPQYHICAVDGGGTGCRVAVATADGTVLARSADGPANYTTDPAMAVGNVLGAVHSALADAGLTKDDWARMVAHVGLAGVMTDADAAALAQRMPFGRCRASDDRLTTTMGALGDRDGAVLAAGTGSFTALRRGGDVQLYGGWGLQVGDHASGAWLGRKALEHTLLAVDGFGESSALTHSLLARYDTPTGIVSFAATARPQDYAALAPLVIEAALVGDVVGARLMQNGADYLNTALTAFGIGPGDVVCLAGGVGPHYKPYLAAEYQALVTHLAGSALDGGLALARAALQREGAQR